MWAESACCCQGVHTTAHLASARQILLWLVRRLRRRCEQTKGWLHALAKGALVGFPAHVLTWDLWYALSKRLLIKKKKKQRRFPGVHRAEKHGKAAESPWYFQGAVLSYLCSSRAPIWEKHQVLKVLCICLCLHLRLRD